MTHEQPATPAKRKTSKTKIAVIAVAALVVFGGCTAALSGSDSDPAPAPATTAPAEPAQETTAPEPTETAIETTAAEMVDALEANPLKAKTTYEGKPVVVTGVVGNIDASGEYFALDPSADAFVLTGIQVYLDESHRDTVADYTKGQKVTVSGTVTAVGEVMGYSIEADTLAGGQG